MLVQISSQQNKLGNKLVFYMLFQAEREGTELSLKTSLKFALKVWLKKETTTIFVDTNDVSS